MLLLHKPLSFNSAVKIYPVTQIFGWTREHEMTSPVGGFSFVSVADSPTASVQKL